MKVKMPVLGYFHCMSAKIIFRHFQYEITYNPGVYRSHQFLNLIPVEESLDIAFLELVELRGQWLCDNGINQLLLVVGHEVVYL